MSKSKKEALAWAIAKEDITCEFCFQAILAGPICCSRRLIKGNSMSEEILVQKIKELEIEQHNARLRISKAKLEAMHAESDLIEFSLKKEALEEKLRIMRLESTDQELSFDEIDKARFKKVFQDLLKKI